MGSILVAAGAGLLLGTTGLATHFVMDWSRTLPLVALSIGLLATGASFAFRAELRP